MWHGRTNGWLNGRKNLEFGPEVFSKQIRYKVFILKTFVFRYLYDRICSSNGLRRASSNNSHMIFFIYNFSFRSENKPLPK